METDNASSSDPTSSSSSSATTTTDSKTRAYQQDQAFPSIILPPTEPISALPDIQSTPPHSSSSSSTSSFIPITANAITTNSDVIMATNQNEVDSGMGGGDGEQEEQQGCSSPPVKVEEEWWNLQMTWAGKTYKLRVGGNDMVYDFRAAITALTQVPPEGQKLIGLTRSKLNASLDGARFSSLGVKNNSKFVLVGTPVDQRFRDPIGLSVTTPADDFDVDYQTARSGRKRKGTLGSRRMRTATGTEARQGTTEVDQASWEGGTAAAHAPGEASVPPHEDPRNLRQVQRVIEECPINVMNEPREGKKLLVLDLDYTLVDTKPLIDGALPSIECARPFMHEFLEAMYPLYDIVIWSQTSWRWLDTKLCELGMVGGDKKYKICFVVDRTPMFPIFVSRDGVPYRHEVKPLPYLWAKFPQWSAKNTIHIDDLSRNFAMNPSEGLRIRAYKSAGQPESLRDNYLDRLKVYLMDIAQYEDDFTKLNHANWKVHKNKIHSSSLHEVREDDNQSSFGDQHPPPPPSSTDSTEPRP